MKASGLLVVTLFLFSAMVMAVPVATPPARAASQTGLTSVECTPNLGNGNHVYQVIICQVGYTFYQNTFPAGELVTFTASSSRLGIFSPWNFCVIPTATVGGCGVDFFPTSAGNITITASYAGDANYAPSSTSTTVTVQKDGTVTQPFCPSTMTTNETYSCDVVIGTQAGFQDASGTAIGPNLSGQGVAFSTTGTGNFSPNVCSIISSGMIAAVIWQCGVSYTPSSTGTQTITASYAGDGNNTASSGTEDVSVVSQATSQGSTGQTIGGYPFTYLVFNVSPDNVPAGVSLSASSHFAWDAASNSWVLVNQPGQIASNGLSGSSGAADIMLIPRDNTLTLAFPQNYTVNGVTYSVEGSATGNLGYILVTNQGATGIYSVPYLYSAASPLVFQTGNSSVVYVSLNYMPSIVGTGTVTSTGNGSVTFKEGGLPYQLGYPGYLTLSVLAGKIAQPMPLSCTGDANLFLQTSQFPYECAEPLGTVIGYQFQPVAIANSTLYYPSSIDVYSANGALALETTFTINPDGSTHAAVGSVSDLNLLPGAIRLDGNYTVVATYSPIPPAVILQYVSKNPGLFTGLVPQLIPIYIKTVLSYIPWWVWAVIIALAAGYGAYWYYNRRKRKQREAAFEKEKAELVAAMENKIPEVVALFTDLAGRLSQSNSSVVRDYAKVADAFTKPELSAVKSVVMEADKKGKIAKKEVAEVMVSMAKVVGLAKSLLPADSLLRQTLEVEPELMSFNSWATKIKVWYELMAKETVMAS